MPRTARISTHMDFQKEQKKAIMHEKGPLLIIAGAGTGKTTVITKRIAHLIAEKKARPGEILALTFTDKAANEMEERVDVLVPYGYVDAWISTFHAFGDRILREFGVELGVDPGYRLLARPEQIMFLRKHLYDFPSKYYRPLGDPTKHLPALVNLISRAKDEDVTCEEYLKFAKGLRSRARAHPKDEELEEYSNRQAELAEIYAKYEDAKAKEGFLDFGDQVTMLLQNLRKNKRILKILQERFKYILVDEFQDTNFAQFELVKLLAAGHENLTVVGDDDQSIFRFRGAAISNILMFQKSYPQTESVVLTQNFRSRQPILDTAYRLIQHNNPDRLEVKAGVDKRLSGVSKGGETPRHVHCDTAPTEADWVAEDIEERGKEEGRKWGDFAILVRANRDADPVIRALNMRNIPVWFSGGLGIYQREEIRLLVHFVRIMAHSDESNSVFYLASSTIYRLDPTLLRVAATHADRSHRNLLDILEKLDEMEGASEFSNEARRAATHFCSEMRRFLSISTEVSAGVLIYRFLKESGFLNDLTRPDSLAAIAQLKNVSRFFEKVRAFEGITPENRVRQFAEYLDGLIESGDDWEEGEGPERADAVQILTVHKSKGLEFPVVYMVATVDGKFPGTRRSEPIPLPDELIKEILPQGDYHIQEERRLFYVGCTRAKEELILTSAASYGGKRERKVSPFILEALDIPKKVPLSVKKSAEEAIALFREEPGLQLFPEKPLAEDEPIALSYSQFETYQQCPLKYYWRYKMRIPQLPHHRFVVGLALHSAAQALNNAKRQDRLLTYDELLHVFERAWRSEGFIHRAHEDPRHSGVR